MNATKILVQFKEEREIRDDSYSAKEGATKVSYVVMNEIDAEVSPELGKKIMQAVHKLLAEES
jgi:hypothetical protein